MARVEQVTVTLPADMADMLRNVVAEGTYASAGEVIRAALRDWQIKSELHLGRLEALRRDIQAGVEDAAAGRLVTPDIDDIMERGRTLSALRDRSVLPNGPGRISPRSRVT